MLSNAVLAELNVEKQLAPLLNKAVYWQRAYHLFVANHCLMICAIICIHYNPENCCFVLSPQIVYFLGVVFLGP